MEPGSEGRQQRGGAGHAEVESRADSSSEKVQPHGIKQMRGKKRS